MAHSFKHQRVNSHRRSAAVVDSLEFRRLFSTGGVKGNLYNDINGDSIRQPGEGPLVGWSVSLQQPGGPVTAITSADGQYKFEGVNFEEASPNVAITVSVQDGWHERNFSLLHQPATITAKLVPNTVVEAKSLGLTQNWYVQGFVWKDVNGDGQFDMNPGTSNEFLLSPQTIYVDANNSGKMEDGELRVQSRTADGSYTIAIPTGVQKLRIATVPAGTTLIDPPAGLYEVNGQNWQTNFPNSPSPNFGFADEKAQISGTVYFDLNGDGVRQDGEGPASGRTVYIDANENNVRDDGEISSITGPLGRYEIGSLSPGVYRLRVVAGESESVLPNIRIITLTAGQRFVDANFGIHSLTGRIAGRVFGDKNGDLIFNTGIETGISGRIVYLDTNNDGDRDDGEPKTTSNAEGFYVFEGLTAGEYHVRVGGDNPAIVTPLVYNIVLTTGQSVSGKDFAITIAPEGRSSISGVVFNDENADGIFNTEKEKPLASRTVYIDSNNNSKLDIGERSTITGTLGGYEFNLLAAGTYKIRQVLPEGWRQTTPEKGYGHNVTVDGTNSVSGKIFGATILPSGISGTVFNDRNANGAYGSEDGVLAGWTIYIDKDRDGKLDAEEQRTTTNSDGFYRFADLPAGSYRIRYVGRDGWRRTTDREFYDINLATNLSTSRFNHFGFTERVLIGGAVFNDANGNARRDDGEKGLPGWKVFVDTDNDGKLDDGERSTTTDSNGYWRFRDLLANTKYTIRVVEQAGYKRTTPSPIVLTLQSGGTSTSNLFGEKKI